MPILQGGLGNQLFILASAYGYCVSNSCTLLLDTKTGFLRDSRYRRKYSLDPLSLPFPKIDLCSNSCLINKFLLSVARLQDPLQSLTRISYRRQLSLDFDHHFLAVSPTSLTVLDGYWQSESYFHHCSSAIRSLLTAAPYSNSLITCDLYASILKSNCPVSLHFRPFSAQYYSRFRDYFLFYYSSAIQQILQISPSPELYIFSSSSLPDCLLSVLSTFNISIIYPDKYPEISDLDTLRLMSLCHHHINACSTFSWWSSWLSSYPHKKIFCPSVSSSGEGQWLFPGLIPDSWTVI